MQGARSAGARWTDARAAARLAAIGAVAASLWLSGCGDGSNIFTGGAGGTGDTTNPGGGGTNTGASDTGASNSGTNTAGTGGTGGTTGNECKDAADCDAVKGGPAACGSWACTAGFCTASSPGCTDDDHDGYGTGANCMCAGLDCDDADDKVADTASATCYSGPAGTDGVGTCHAGTQSCTAGAWSPCGGEVIPSGEACNGEDDDCDATPDDNLGSFSCGLGQCAVTIAACTNGQLGLCVPGAPGNEGAQCDNIDNDCDGVADENCKACVPVTPNGVDATANGTFLLPFGTIQAAIDYAANTANAPKLVCVAGGLSCNNTFTYANAANTTITMADGVSVVGSYEATNWTQCNAITTFIQPQTAEGVTFPATVQKVTSLNSFRIDRFNAATTAGVTVNGAQNAILWNLTINNLPTGANSYGVNIINGGFATVTKSRIDAGNGTSEAIAVRVIGSKVNVDNNCASLDALGHCDDHCNGGANPSLRGSTGGGIPAVTYAVLLQDSPGSLVQTSAMCGVDGGIGAAVRVIGDGTGIEVRGNLIDAWGGAQDAHGVWMEDCNDAKPWIVENYRISANGDTDQTRVNAVRAIGSCHPVVDNNVQITSGGEGMAFNPIGVYCGINAQNVPSKCAVLDNGRIEGSAFGFPTTATGIRCDDGGCNRIANNRLITGRGGVTSWGIRLASTGTVVENNRIRGGCSQFATGVETTDAYARIQNNIIFGSETADCAAGGTVNVQQSYGLRAFVQAGLHEIDVHSNDIDGTGQGAAGSACISRGVTIDVAPGAAAGKMGIFRNNTLRAGLCPMSRLNFLEAAAGADPRVLENNNFDPYGIPSALYLDENMTALPGATEINTLLVDITSSGNMSADPLFVSYPTDIHLQGASPCIGKGTPVGAPPTDYEGTPRDALTPDIGADEN